MALALLLVQLFSPSSQVLASASASSSLDGNDAGTAAAGAGAGAEGTRAEATSSRATRTTSTRTTRVSRDIPLKESVLSAAAVQRDYGLSPSDYHHEHEHDNEHEYEYDHEHLFHDEGRDLQSQIDMDTDMNDDPIWDPSLHPPIDLDDEDFTGYDNEMDGYDTNMFNMGMDMDMDFYVNAGGDEASSYYSYDTDVVDGEMLMTLMEEQNEAETSGPVVNMTNADAIIRKRSGSHSKSRSRSLSPDTYKFGTFHPLDCNPENNDFSNTACTTPVSTRLPAAGQPLIVPCGQCYTFDLTGNVTALSSSGIQVEGKLRFPPNHPETTIYTPFVIVQGELEITANHDTLGPDNQVVRFILVGTGTDVDDPEDDVDVLFSSTKSPNQNACANFENGVCNLGRKPFVVAGGRVNIQSTMPSGCETWTPLLSQVYKDPVYVNTTENFRSYVSLTPSCQSSAHGHGHAPFGVEAERVIASYDFTNGDNGNFTGRWGTYMVNSDGSTSMKVTNRRLRDRGPSIDLTPFRPELCLVPDQDYLFVARYVFILFFLFDIDIQRIHSFIHFHLI